ncbi:MAG TPA: DNA-formamidopyrimidine glycosylase family protein, partial [Solirubrobacteraceae bacterium]|nr:DNA-formamidopyrimidine glycosylase family protein [Solirubrobacteraceae bacterium]
MPELPEVEITARLLDGALAGARITSATAPGINALKTFEPPLSALEGERIEGVRRRGKHLIVEVSGGLFLLIHLMSAGRLQLYDKPAGPRDRTSRLLVRVLPTEREGRPPGTGALSPGEPAERELRLREFGSKQAAWVKLLTAEGLAADPSLAALGPEAWPDPPPLDGLLDAPRPLHALLRDQHVIAGIGRSWVDEILWRAGLSPFKRAADLDSEESDRLREAIAGTLGGALEHYERAIVLPIPDKLPMPLEVHRHEGESCPRCRATLRAVHFEDYVIA